MSEVGAGGSRGCYGMTHMCTNHWGYDSSCFDLTRCVGFQAAISGR